MKSAASAPRYANPSQSSGADSSMLRRSPGVRYRNAATRRRTPACPGAPATVMSALDLGPGLGPLGVVGALGIGAPVQALGDRRRPVEDLRGEVRVVRVVGVAE